MGRVYATASDLQDWTGQTPPADADRQLARASESVDDALLTAVYAVDGAGMPTDTAVQDALRDATCAVVEWWTATGDELGASAGWSSVTAGAVALSRPTAGQGPGVDGELPPRAYGVLRRAGLLPGTVLTNGDTRW